MTTEATAFGPNTGPGRIELLDAIRGFALFGILLMNLEAFNGPILMALSGIDASLSGADRMADAFIYIFVQGKFWTLFSLLFGIGFAMMFDSAERSGADFRRIYKRRLWALMAIGAAHAILIWEGDILFAYAVSGFVLLWRMKNNAVPRLWPIVLTYCAPLALITIGGFLAPAQSQGQDLANMLAEEIKFQGHSTYWVTLQWRAGYFIESLGNLFVLLPLAVAVFAMGVRLHRSGWTKAITGPENAAGSRVLGFYGSGMALMLLSVWVAPSASPAEFNATFAMVNVLNMLSGFLMCLGMFFGLRWLWANPAAQTVMARLAPLGRMALSNYLMQSVVCTLIFCGYGLGYFQQMPRAWHIPFALILITLQTVFSTWWLGRFSMGPAEYIWRWLTYGKRPKFVS